MKRYKFEVLVKEGYDHFWDSIKDKTGCDEVLVAIQECIDAEGWEAEVRLVEYTNDCI